MEQTLERRPWLVPMILALLTVIFLRQVILPSGADYALDGKDFQAMFYPLQEVIQQTIKSGELPLWNPHQFIGHPLVGNPHTALLYPASWLMWAFGVVRGMNLSMVFHGWLGAWGMAVFLRRLKSSHLGSLLAGIIYAMSGWAATRYYVGHYNLFVIFGWIPWMMAAYHYALEKRTLRSTLPGMAVTGIALLGGHPPLMLDGGIALVTLWVFDFAQRDDFLRGAVESGLLLTAIVVGGVLLGAAMVFPAAELAQVSARSSSDLSFANSFALPPAQFLMLAFPNFFGNPKVPPYYYYGADFFEEFLAYAGMLPLVAIPLLFRWRKTVNWYFLGLVALGCVMAVGLDGALMPMLWRWVPGFTLFRTPGRSLYFVMIGMAGATAMLVTALQAATVEERREALRPAVRLWLPVAIALCFVGAVYFSGWYVSASHVEPMPLRAFTASGALATGGIILLGVWFVFWLWSDDHPKAYNWALLLTCLLVTLDAWHVGIPIITVSELHEDPLWAGARVNIPLGADARVVAPLGFENLASVTGHLNVTGYDPLPVETFRKLAETTDASDPSAPVNTLLGVKYFMTTKPYDKPDFKLIGIADKNNIYYQRTDAFPRTWIATTVMVEPNDDAVRLNHIAPGKEDLSATVYLDHAVDCPSAGGTAEITDYRANSVTIAAHGNGGMLTLSDQYYPGWTATVDGNSVPIVRADTVFRSVCVPAGDHTVRFEYRPMSFFTGVACTAIGWLLWLILALVMRFRW
jgi:hypothetical protein